MIAFKYENGGVFYCQAFSLFWLAFSSSSYGGLSHSSAVVRSRNCPQMIPNRRSRKPTVANRSSRGLLWQKLRTGLVNLYQAKRLLAEFWWVDSFHSRFNAVYVMTLLIVDSWRSDRCSRQPERSDFCILILPPLGAPPPTFMHNRNLMKERSPRFHSPFVSPLASPSPLRCDAWHKYFVLALYKLISDIIDPEAQTN